MKLLFTSFLFFLTVSVFGQLKDTVYVDAAKKLVLKSAKNPDNRSLIEIDGKIYNGTLESIDVNNINSFDVLDHDAAVVLYGEKGKNGAILFKFADLSKIKLANERLQKIKEYILSNKCVLIVNHVIYKGDVNAIRSVDISNIDIVDSDYTLKYYGISTKGGAVLVSTKQKIDPLTGLFIERQ